MASDDDFNIGKLAIDTGVQLPPTRAPKARGERQVGQFLKGPIPMVWLERAARLPGRALHVGLAIWHQTALERRETVGLPNKLLTAFGVDRDAKRRALHVLEDAGLIEVTRGTGRLPVVTRKDVP